MTPKANNIEQIDHEQEMQLFYKFSHLKGAEIRRENPNIGVSTYYIAIKLLRNGK